jgi:hypothetical protein
MEVDIMKKRNNKINEYDIFNSKAAAKIAIMFITVLAYDEAKYRIVTKVNQIKKSIRRFLKKRGL